MTSCSPSLVPPPNNLVHVIRQDLTIVMAAIETNKAQFLKQFPSVLKEESQHFFDRAEMAIKALKHIAYLIKDLGG